jgi:anaerobic selenocysteine-containing dehydrogenase
VPGPPPSASFPVRLFFCADPADWSAGTLSRRELLLQRELVEDVLMVSPGDLAELEIGPGQSVKIATAAAEATLRTRQSLDLPPGVVMARLLSGSPAARLRGFFPDAERLSFGVQPVASRLEKV